MPSDFALPDKPDSGTRRSRDLFQHALFDENR
jgi:hypothetical protein